MSRRRVLAAVLGLGLALGAAPLLPTGAQATGLPSGPDVSRWQHGSTLDWSAVRSAGAAFTVVKATEGSTGTSSWFAPDYAAVAAQGMARGSYHFARPALPMSTARLQAQHYADVLGSVRSPGDLPPVLDLEQDGGLSPGDLVTWAQTFLAELHTDTGRTPVVYTYPYFWRTAMADSTAFTRFPLWIAGYGTTTPQHIGGWPTWTLWQYTDDSRLPGISGPVDGNVFNTATGSLASFADGTRLTSWPVGSPAAPAQVWASGAGSAAIVHWVPGDDGGARPTSWRVRASTGTTTTVSGSATTATVTGLPAGQSVTFTVKAVNAAGTGASSVPTNPVTTTAVSVLDTWASWYGVRPGAPAAYWAHLTLASGTPLVDRPVTLYAWPAGAGGWSFVSTLLTDGTGHVHWSYAATSTTALSVRYAGSSLYAPSRGLARTIYLAGPAPVVATRLSATSVPLGGTVRLYGAVTPGTTGQPVVRQAYYAGAWHTVATTALTSGHTYSFPVHPSTRTTRTYRVRVQAFAGRPAAVGPTVLLRVT